MACNCGCNQKKKCSKKSYGSYTKYVKGGLCEPGDGSKCKPWNSLALAQAGSWETLVVLSSPIALDGGILLKDGQKLVGEKSPVDGPLEYDQPTITNTDLLSNGGNGVLVQSGSVEVKNLHITNTQVSAINYDNAKDLFVKEVLVTGHNQSQSRVAMGYTDFQGRTSIYYAGIHGQNSHYGKTTICKIVIRDNFAGPGVYDVSKDGAHREFKFIKSELSALVRSSVEDEAPYDVTTFGYGVASVAVGVGSKKVGKVYKSSVLDFLCNFGEVPAPTEEDPDATIRTRNIGFSGEVFGGAETTFTVEKSVIKNMNVLDTCRGFGVYGFSSDNTPGSIDKLNFNVLCSVITGVIGSDDAIDGSIGIITLYDNTDGIFVFKDNTVYNVNVAFQSSGFNQGVGNNKINELIEGNYFRSPVHPINLPTTVSNRDYLGIIRKNTIIVADAPDLVGSGNCIQINIVEDGFWNSFNMTIDDNCLTNITGALFDTAPIVFIGASNVDNVINIDTNRNNVVTESGIAVAILNFGALLGGNVNLGDNYWEPSPPFIFVDAPDLNVTEEPFVGLPFECPKTKFCIPEISTPEPQSVSSLNTLSVSEKVEQFKERVLQRYRK